MYGYYIEEVLRADQDVIDKIRLLRAPYAHPRAWGVCIASARNIIIASPSAIGFGDRDAQFRSTLEISRGVAFSRFNLQGCGPQHLHIYIRQLSPSHLTQRQAALRFEFFLRRKP